MGRDASSTAEDGPPDPEGADPQGQDKRDGSRDGRAIQQKDAEQCSPLDQNCDVIVSVRQC